LLFEDRFARQIKCRTHEVVRAKRKPR
jgi:hypothetical protein